MELFVSPLRIFMMLASAGLKEMLLLNFLFHALYDQNLTDLGLVDCHN